MMWQRGLSTVRVMTLSLVTAACGAAASAAHPTSEPSAAQALGARHGHEHQDEHAPSGIRDDDLIEKKLDEVAVIHGAPGPWAVLGYRMSEHALAKLGLQRGSFALEVVHWTPREVRYSCIADGAAAHSGASLGKLNLSLVETTPDDVRTIYRNKTTGKSLALRPTASFRKRFADTPRAKARELGREVLVLPPGQVFEETSLE